MDRSVVAAVATTYTSASAVVLLVAGAIASAVVFEVRKRKEEKPAKRFLYASSPLALCIAAIEALTKAGLLPLQSAAAPAINVNVPVTVSNIGNGSNNSKNANTNIVSSPGSEQLGPRTRSVARAELRDSARREDAAARVMAPVTSAAAPQGLEDSLVVAEARERSTQEYWGNVQRQMGAEGHDLRPEIKTGLYSAKAEIGQCKKAAEVHEWTQTANCVHSLTETLDKLDLYK